MIEVVPLAMLVALTLSAFYTDATTKKIPNRLNGCFLGLGIAWHSWSGGWQAGAYAIAAAAICLGILSLLYLFGVLGGGDVKYFAALGAVAGLEWTLYILIASIMYGGVLALGYMLMKRGMLPAFVRWLHLVFGAFFQGSGVSQAISSAKVRFPFMYAVLPAVSTIVVWQFGMGGG